jgi:AraC-like DNA-binding protein
MPHALLAPPIDWDLRTEDLAAYHARVSGLLKPFALTGKPRGYYDARLAHRRLWRSELTLIDYGEEVAVDAGTMNDFYVLQVPLRGSYCSYHNGQSLVVRQGQAHLIHESLPLTMDCARDLSLLVFKLDRAALTALWPGDPGRRTARAERFGTVLTLDDGPGHSLRRTIEFVAAESLQPGLFHHHPVTRRHAEELLLAAIAASQDGAARDEMPPARAAPPPCVRRAEAFIEQHLRDELTLDQIVAASRVGARTLFYGFRKTHGIGPWAWARARRLEGARQALQSAAARSLSVTDVALDWGFAHLGRFSAAYRLQFGEAPSETLAQARRGRSS